MSATPSVIATLRKQDTHVNWQELLADIIAAFGCSAGTIHFFNAESELLILQAHQGIPPFLLPKISEIPIGKGIAGVAAQRRQPVEMCNLQTDESGVARPAAKQTKVEGSIAVPMLLDDELYGTVGIAKSIPYDFAKDEEETLMEIGREISIYLRAQASPGSDNI